MKTEVREVVDEMFAAFEAKDLNRVVNTFSDDAICIYHGTQRMPSAKFLGKEGAKMFFEFNFHNFQVVHFTKNHFIEEGNTIAVLGSEHFISNQDGNDYFQQWVQVYTVREGLIVRMEEFATSALPSEYGGNSN